MYDAKITAEFAVDPIMSGPGLGLYPACRHTDPNIVAQNHQQRGWYCWTPFNDDPDKQTFGAYAVPTWDLGDIPPGQSATVVMMFSVTGNGLDPTGAVADLRGFVVENSAANGTDVLSNRTTSLKISTWIDDLVRDWGVPYPHDDDLPPLRSSNCSVFHDTVRRLRIVGVLDFDWVYVNTPVTTQWRHESICTVTAVREAAPGELYTVAVQENGVTPMTNFVLGLTS